MKGNIFDKIRRASIKYQGYILDCYEIAKEAQKYIDGGFFRKDKFLIVDKETKKFMKVKVSDCEVLEY